VRFTFANRRAGGYLRFPNGAMRYLHRGIQSGPFEHRFALADNIEVREVHMANRLLTVELTRVVPEPAAPCRIAIMDAARRCPVTR